MLRTDFSFVLPEELIASFPSKERTACRMLCLDGNSGQLRDQIFSDLQQFLQPGDLLVFNDTKVIPARIYGHKDTGGKCEFLIERLLTPHQALTHIKASKAPKAGTVIYVGPASASATNAFTNAASPADSSADSSAANDVADAASAVNVADAAVASTSKATTEADSAAAPAPALPSLALAAGQLPEHCYAIKVLGRQGDLFHIDCGAVPLLDILDDIGHIPLPPYIQRPDEASDRERYQTVYSREPGAVAAPTAGLHFDEAQLAALKAYGVEFAFVTLHVGAGTFQPVREDDILKHHMHTEYVQLSPEVAEKVIATHARGNRVIAVGTTAVRSLESAAQAARRQGLAAEITSFYDDTSIFIYPGYHYQVVDALITNFHLPESTLIMLVCAFAGYHNTMQAYVHALEQRYKFFSYGDCMFITKRTAEVDLPPSALVEQEAQKAQEKQAAQKA